MRAIVRDRYGVDALELREVDEPELTDGGVLVRVRASSVNRAEWYAVTGVPYFVRPQTGLTGPKERTPGVDFAGTVEAVGKDVAHLRPGDDVYGGKTGAWAEYVVVENAVVPKPASVSFEEAASVGTAALTALQGLRDKAGVQAGKKVLVNGASGGVGTFAVQIAKALGAEVTAVCSTRNVEQARELGADRVIDYTREDFTRVGERYDVLFDVAGSRPWREVTRVLASDAVLVQAGAPIGGRLLGPVAHIAATRVASLPSRRKAVFFVAKFNRPDLETLRELIDAGKVRPAVEERYELAEVADAVRRMGEGHSRGKLVLSVG